ncbi:putative histidine biosynthesis protein [Aurantimonas manganoxydans SI85-9A1]|uniref:Putative histidine biosynthesis protein n=1 Tax=Aurantimonas manganoxydans (strain ATCC BAA-1229 / DSM 21871 / SI85-9A1) TaxID=287752 RepID=Q1YFX4_AURMS|nr:HisA/HisF-related TIM barrel protein [Aurantimonas manganoxydans]EAS49452.1 putative histidine biosynthesis protein [Aurantimonas manganoxydans SI85-9A1]
MQIIPVLDIKDGRVVRGVMGDRANYRPIETPLAEGADPVAVARGLMALAPFRSLYIADLDAIEGRPANDATIARLGTAFPTTEIWIDGGVHTTEDAQRVLAQPRHVAVVGTESIEGTGVARDLAGEPRAVLSLDFRGDDFLGPVELLTEASLWPRRLIVMTLARVGSGAGPDLERLASVAARAGDRAIFAAGGVRGADDVTALAEAGITGALVSTALHDGRLAPADLQRFL